MEQAIKKAIEGGWKPFGAILHKNLVEQKWCVNQWGRIVQEGWENSEADIFALATKNCFKTEAEAEQRLSEIKKEHGIK